MAQGAITMAPSVGAASLTRNELHEIQEYEKIIRFRDIVYSGAHPRIQIPPHLAGKSLVKPLSPNTVVTPSNQPPTPYSSTAPAAKTYTGRENGGDGDKLLDGRRLMAGRPTVALGKSNKSEINPILLEKSADLIKAEIQLHRQRLERSLRDQVDQRRISMKAASQTSESLPDFDLSDVLSKAFTIVHPSMASEAGQSQGGRTSASDSFDDNTFYSSQHNTPEHGRSPRGHRESGEVYPSAVAPLNAPDSGPLVVRYQEESPNFISKDATPSNVVPGLHELARNQSSAPPNTPHPTSTLGAVGVNQSNELLKAAISNKPAADIARPVAEKHDFALTPHSNVSTPQGATPSRIEADERNRIAQGGPDAVPSQVASATPQKRRLSLEEPETVRNFNLSPVAPQPARVSPLATARAPVISQEAFTLQEEPILSPMHEAGASSATGGIPKTSKRAERRKGKGKSDDTGNNPASAIATPASPHIKPEPKSPSPFQSAPLPRPHKRQRQTLQHGAGLDYDEPTEDTIMMHPVVPRTRDARPRPVQRGGERLGEAMEIDQPQRHRIARDEAPGRRIVSQEIYRDPPSPAMYAVPYPQYEQRPVRASSRMVADTYYQEPPAYYREPPAAPGSVIELDANHDRSLSPILMAPPPRIAPSRIIVDEYGRQYYTTAPNPPGQSVAPQPRIIDDSYYYDRPPPRRAIRRAVQHAYEDDGVIYRRASPQYVPQRRVITLPENLAEPQYRQREYSTRPVATRPPAEDYAAPGEREPIEIRQREYSTRPPPARQPVDDYVRVAEAPRRQPSHFEGPPPHEYLSQRVASAHPEAFRHEMHGEYIPRAQSIRPQPRQREYAGSVRPEGRRGEVQSQIIREYSVRPGEQEVVRREHMPPRTMDEYQQPPPGRPMARRVVEEQEYIPWRPGQQEVYGGEDTQREVIYK
ncbi:hypothetical protein VC83_01991 [Pseudogymnoascus destructans]|uniref:Uncharacterized protein n=2 Tax=Pseudogymnoascus destructans TaxID=655981 RepID=L8FU31_PSED2|nr:uncharacterized protein VC83_01991 [Pseudogymnoascus destructans]ELR04475.1 hypothetical protein GMDG_06781 [Pseudogymnoascus destructans 20631-21]OAF61420.1 hypothetical protein VC83_01991 [Pseudogymnoascus destructans]